MTVDGADNAKGNRRSMEGGGPDGKEDEGGVEAHAATDERRFSQRILVATDFSEHAQKAVETAAGLARVCSPESLLILHVFDVSGLPIIQSYPYYYGKVNKAMVDEIRNRAEKVLADLAEPYLAEFPQAVARLETGRTPFVILEAAREMDADLIILGVAGLGGGRSGMGSTALKVIRRSSCPVLVAHHVASDPDTRKSDRAEARHLRRMKREARRRLRREQRDARKRLRFERKNKPEGPLQPGDAEDGRGDGTESDADGGPPRS